MKQKSWAPWYRNACAIKVLRKIENFLIIFYLRTQGCLLLHNSCRWATSVLNQVNQVIEEAQVSYFTWGKCVKSLVEVLCVTWLLFLCIFLLMKCLLLNFALSLIHWFISNELSELFHRLWFNCGSQEIYCKKVVLMNQ